MMRGRGVFFKKLCMTMTKGVFIYFFSHNYGKKIHVFVEGCET